MSLRLARREFLGFELRQPIPVPLYVPTRASPYRTVLNLPLPTPMQLRLSLQHVFLPSDYINQIPPKFTRTTHPPITKTKLAPQHKHTHARTHALAVQQHVSLQPHKLESIRNLTKIGPPSPTSQTDHDPPGYKHHFTTTMRSSIRASNPNGHVIPHALSYSNISPTPAFRLLSLSRPLSPTLPLISPTSQHHLLQPRLAGPSARSPLSALLLWLQQAKKGAKGNTRSRRREGYAWK